MTGSSSPGGARYTEAVADLNSRVNLEATIVGRASAPTLDRIVALLAAMGDPQRTYPVIHVTGTNGKGSTVAMISALVAGRGLTVGTYTSPDLERVNERIARNGTPIGDDDLVESLRAVAALEPLAGVRATRFELLTA
ncbi:MAG: bifunctional folylpolyglutamate synthase/dihydrofolate synthase, partial [Acidimicrobiales bacterium]